MKSEIRNNNHHSGKESSFLCLLIYFTQICYGLLNSQIDVIRNTQYFQLTAISA